MQHTKNTRDELKAEIGKLVQTIVELSEMKNPPFHDVEILQLSKEIDALINTYYDIS